MLSKARSDTEERMLHNAIYIKLLKQADIEIQKNQLVIFFKTGQRKVRAGGNGKGL